MLADLGHEVPTSLLTSTLGAPAAALGLIDGVAGAARFGGGVLADDLERCRWAVGGYTATAVLSSLNLGTAVWQVVPFSLTALA